MNKILKKYYVLIIFLFFLIVSSIYFWPFLKNPAFNLIDDGVSLQISRQIISGDFTNFIEINNGRVRPLYWLYFSFIYLFTGMNPLGFWIGQTLVVTATLFSLWYLLTGNTDLKKWKTHLIGFVLPVIFFIPAISENLYRLGTAEVRQLLFIILFLIWMKQSIEKVVPNWIGFLLFILALLTKETSIFLTPLLIIFYFPYIVKEYLSKTKIKKHKDKVCFLIFFGFFTLIYYSLLSAMKDSSSYASGFGLNLSQLKLNFLISRLEMNEIYYLLLIMLTLGITRLFLFLKEKKIFAVKRDNFIFKVILDFWLNNSFIVAILFGLFSSLIFVFSWQWQLGRYYYPVYIFLLIYSYFEVKKSAEIYLGFKNIKSAILMISAPFFVVILSYMTLFQKNTPDLKEYLSKNHEIKRLWFSDYQNSYSIINYLLNMKTSKLFLLVNDYEVVYELGLFTNRTDFKKNQIKTVSTNEQISIKDHNFYFTENVEEDYLNDQNQDSILVTTELKNISLDLNEYTKEQLTNDFLIRYSDRPDWIIWRKK